MKSTFNEEQKFKQIWLWIILIVIGIIQLSSLYTQFIKKEDIENKTSSNSGVIIGAIVSLLIIGLFLIMKLKTTINKTYISIYFFPFVKKKYYWNQIKNRKVLNYGFIGGWGIRFSKKYGTVYNIKGNKGLAIELKNGKKILVGTQKYSDLKKYIESRTLIKNISIQ